MVYKICRVSINLFIFLGTFYTPRRQKAKKRGLIIFIHHLPRIRASMKRLVSPGGTLQGWRIFSPRERLLSQKKHVLGRIHNHDVVGPTNHSVRDRSAGGHSLVRRDVDAGWHLLAVHDAPLDIQPKLLSQKYIVFCCCRTASGSYCRPYLHAPNCSARGYEFYNVR